MRNVYTEHYKGQLLTRTEPPMQTAQWLERRIELAEGACRTARWALDQAVKKGAGVIERRRLAGAVAEADDQLDHARAMVKAFAAVWNRHDGYLDAENWESTQQARAAAAKAAADAALEEDAAPERDVEIDEEGEGASEGDPPEPEEEAAAGSVGRPQPAPDPNEAADGSADVPGAPDVMVGAVAFDPDAGDGVAPPGRYGPMPPRALAPGDTQTEPEAPSLPAAPEPSAAPPARPKVTRSYKGMKNTPPEETRWVKGCKSPNQDGRPKGSKNMKTIVNAALNQTIKVKGVGGRNRTITMRAAIIEVHLRKAVAGDTKSAMIMLALSREFAETDKSADKPLELTEEERSILKNRLAMMKLLGSGDDKDEGDDEEEENDDGEDKS